MRRVVSARSLRTKTEVAGEFAHHGSGYVLIGYLAAASLLRARRGRPTLTDAKALVAVVALQPFFEWALHRFVLHSRPRNLAGQSFDPGAAHRGHHRVPDDVGGALLGTGYAASNGVGVAVLAGAVGRLGAGPGGALAGVIAGEAGLLSYEWTHLLAHSGYQPHTAWYRSLRAAHLRHHFRSERTNFGVTSRLGDRLFRTAA